MRADETDFWIEPESYLEICNLMSAYMYALGSDNVDNVMDCFSSGDSVWVEDPPPVGYKPGQAGVREFFQMLIDRHALRPRNYRSTILVTNRIIGRDDTKRRGQAEWVVIGTKENRPSLVRYGYYTDAYLHEGEKWKFESRHMRIWRQGSMPDFSAAGGNNG